MMKEIMEAVAPWAEALSNTSTSSPDLQSQLLLVVEAVRQPGTRDPVAVGVTHPLAASLQVGEALQQQVPGRLAALPSKAFHCFIPTARQALQAPAAHSHEAEAAAGNDDEMPAPDTLAGWVLRHGVFVANWTDGNEARMRQLSQTPGHRHVGRTRSRRPALRDAAQRGGAAAQGRRRADRHRARNRERRERQDRREGHSR
mgnify:CR=1 FL=1